MTAKGTVGAPICSICNKLNIRTELFLALYNTCQPGRTFFVGSRCFQAVVRTIVKSKQLKKICLKKSKCQVVTLSVLVSAKGPSTRVRLCKQFQLRFVCKLNRAAILHQTPMTMVCHHILTIGFLKINLRDTFGSKLYTESYVKSYL
jgi:hypothetical protein